MNKNIISCYSWCHKTIIRLRHHQKISGTLYRNSIRGLKGNTLKIGAYLAKNRIIIEGQGNYVSIDGRFDSGLIRIIGHNNRLIIEPGCNISRATILFRGDNEEIIIGPNAYFPSGCKIVSHGNHNYIHIGKDCMFSDNVHIWNSDTHQILNADNQIINPSKPITIEDHVWLGRGVSVVKGVRIGHDSVIGMGSLVTKNIPANSVAAGVPAQTIKKNTHWDKNYVQEVEF